MTGPKLAESKAPARHGADTAAPDLHFLRSVFDELTGQAQRGPASRPSAAAPSRPGRIVRTPPKPVE